MGRTMAAVIWTDSGIARGAGATVTCVEFSKDMVVPIVEMDIQRPCRVTGKRGENQQNGEKTYHGGYCIGGTLMKSSAEY